MNKRKKAKMKKIAVSTAALMLTPIIGSAIIKALPVMDAFAQAATDAVTKAAFVSAGLTMPEGGKLVIEEKLDKTKKTAKAVDLIHNDEPLLILSSNEENIPNEPLMQVNAPDSTDAEDNYTGEDLDEGIDLYAEGNHDGVIEEMTYTSSFDTTFINLARGGQVRNCTYVSNADLIQESKQKPDIEITAGGEPQVLIMHTHTTESFEPYERDYYDLSFPTRSLNEKRNMAAVGAVIAKQLENSGIGVIHDTTIHDSPSYNGSYQRSEITVKKILEQNPGIKVVLDIHRDAIERADGTRIAPIVEINGQKAAQIMIISGCDDGTFNMPDYMQNFRLASMFQQQMESDNPGITRAVLFDYRQYNQHLTTGSLLIEVGGHSNTLEQALYSAELIGNSIAEVLLSLN